LTKQTSNKYAAILSEIFRAHYKKGVDSFEFLRPELEATATKLGITLPKNLGDLIYSFRFRTAMPNDIATTASKGREWIIELAGTAKYRFRLAKINRIVPRENQYEIKIPDATPEIIRRHALTDEQALLAIVRYNRLIDIFLGVTAYSLQNHLRTNIPGVGQTETDEVYVAVRQTGEQFVVPVQAKGGNDQLGAVQLRQDLALCTHVFSHLTCRLVAVQFKKAEDVIVMFEVTLQGDELKVLEERHYRLVPAGDITSEDLETMRRLK